MSTSEMIDALRHRGITLSVVAGKLVARPASALTGHDREVIRGSAQELVAALTAEREPDLEVDGEVGRATWDQSAALRMMFDADTLVERLGIDGRHPEIAAAAARVTAAHMTRDMLSLRRAVSEFETTVRRVHSRAGA